MEVYPSVTESAYLPWDYLIYWPSGDTTYTGLTSNKSGIRDHTDRRLSYSEILVNQTFPFMVINTSLTDTNGNNVIMDMVVQDIPDSSGVLNGTFELENDLVLVGAPGLNGRWAGTAFALEFDLLGDGKLPEEGDIYQVKFNRPFFDTDTIRFTVKQQAELDIAGLKATMKDIKVVPNPYIATNMMEPSTTVNNRLLNQSRRLMFTNVPAQCTITIFTISGVLVDQIQVDYVNPPEDAHKIDPLNYQLGDPATPAKGIVHWDMLSREGLEIAAGMYLFHVKSDVTGDEKFGKFAIIK